MTISRFLTMSFALLVILTTTACQVTPPHPALPSKVTSAETGSDAPQLMRKAEQAGPDEAARLRLAAAEAFQSAGDTASATAALNATDPSRLDGARQFTFYNLRALLALDAHDYAAAKQAIGLAVPTNAAERNAFALTVADLAEAQQRFEDAALSLMGYTYSPRAVDDRTVRGHRRTHVGGRQSNTGISDQRAGKKPAERSIGGLVATGRFAATQFRSRCRACCDQ